MWLVFAFLSALFASLTSILAKVGIDGVNSNLATAIRTVVVLAMAWGIVFLTDSQSGIFRNKQKKLDIFDFVWACDRSLLAVLLQGSANRGGFKGCPGR